MCKNAAAERCVFFVDNQARFISVPAPPKKQENKKTHLAKDGFCLYLIIVLSHCLANQFGSFA
jgi:hypothetical protein